MDLKTFTKIRANTLGDNGVYPDEVVLSIFDDLAKEHNYTQILFELGKQYLEVCLRYHEVKEEYEICAEIIRQVDKYNRTRGEDIKLTPW